MKRRTKVAGLLLAAVLLVVGTVFGTMAYLTDNESVTNTFTVGKVYITLDEEDVDNSSSEARDQENEYHLIPGHEYAKDPTVHIQADSEDCYVFVTVRNDIADIESAEIKDADDKVVYSPISDQMTANGWSRLLDAEENEISLEDVPVYVYKGTDPTDPPASANNIVTQTDTSKGNIVVFECFRIDGESVINGTTENHPVNAEDGQHYIGDYETDSNKSKNLITVTAYAVQADGFENALDAWTSTFGK